MCDKGRIMKKIKVLLLYIWILSICTACSSYVSTDKNKETHKEDTYVEKSSQETYIETDKKDDTTEELIQNIETKKDERVEDMEELVLTVDGKEISVDWENNKTVKALKTEARELPIHINMSMYGGFEQVGSLGFALPKEDVAITTNPGDIVLYNGDSVVMFYGSNSWDYTKLGHIKDMSDTDLEKLLGSGDVEVDITIK